MTDPRYQTVTCTTCKKRWQQIDFGCAAHVFFCAEPKVEDRQEVLDDYREECKADADRTGRRAW